MKHWEKCLTDVQAQEKQKNAEKHVVRDHPSTVAVEQEDSGGEPTQSLAAAEAIFAPKSRKAPTRAHRKLMDTAVKISMARPSDQDATYMARELVQCTLPHRNPGNIEVWTRRNGNLTLAVQPGWDHDARKSAGYPFGSIPRLLLFWITSEAIRTQSRRLELGSSLGLFMSELGLNPDNGTGKRSDARRLRDQMQRLFRARISFEYRHEDDGRMGKSWLDMQVAPKGELWWDVKNLDQATLWGSWIELGEVFYHAITAAPVPVDIRALKALKSSPLALDLYAWLNHESYRAHMSGKGRFVSWVLLMEQLGAEYSNPKDFGKRAREALRKVKTVYPALELGGLRAGIRIEPGSFPSIQPKPRLTLNQRSAAG